MCNYLQKITKDNVAVYTEIISGLANIEFFIDNSTKK